MTTPILQLVDISQTFLWHKKPCGRWMACP